MTNPAATPIAEIQSCWLPWNGDTQVKQVGHRVAHLASRRLERHLGRSVGGDGQIEDDRCGKSLFESHA